jgi:hypothetical protein
MALPSFTIIEIPRFQVCFPPDRSFIAPKRGKGVCFSDFVGDKREAKSVL